MNPWRSFLPGIRCATLLFFASISCAAQTPSKDYGTWADYNSGIPRSISDWRGTTPPDTSIAGRTVELKLDLSQITRYESPEFVRQIMGDFEDFIVPVSGGMTIEDIVSGSCHLTVEGRAAYFTELEHRATAGRLKVFATDNIFPESSRTAIETIFDFKRPISEEGAIQLPFCLPKIADISAPVVSVPENATFSQLYYNSNEQWAQYANVIEIREVSLSALRSIAQVNATSPYSYFSATESVHSALNAETLSSSSVSKIKPGEPLLLLPGISVKAVVRSHPTDLSSYPEGTISRGASGLIEPLSDEEAEKSCDSRLATDYGRSAQIMSSVFYNQLADQRRPALQIQILVADTGLVDPQDHSLGDSVYRPPNLPLSRLKAFPGSDRYPHGSQVTSILSGGWLASDVRSIFARDMLISPVNIFQVTESGAAIADGGLISKLLDEIPTTKIVNLSVAFPPDATMDSELLRDHHNTLFVMAAGNRQEHLRQRRYVPAWFGDQPNGITVAALGSDRSQKAAFSAYSTSIAPTANVQHSKDFIPSKAPQDDIVSIASLGCFVSVKEQVVGEEGNVVERPARGTGTSLSAPHVSFAAAMIAREGFVYPWQIKNRILLTSDFVSELQGVQYGRRLNIERAIGVHFDQITTSAGREFRGFVTLEQFSDSLPWDERVQLCDLGRSNSVEQYKPRLRDVARITREFWRDGIAQLSPDVVIWYEEQRKIMLPQKCRPREDIRLHLDNLDGESHTFRLSEIRDVTFGIMKRGL